MKRCISFLLAVVLVLSVMPAFPVIADDTVYTSGDFQYTVSNGEATITKHTGEFYADTYNTVVIPAALDGYPVIAIGERAFWESSMDAVVFPDSVKSIGEYAFYECKNLTAVYLPDSISHIGECAFLYCYELSAITLPDSITRIEPWTFAYCNIPHLTIPDSVTYIGEGAFRCCNLESVSLPNGITSVEAYTFADCNSLVEVVLPDSLTSIGSQAFENCFSLSQISIPYGVHTIGPNAFEDCYGLSQVVLPNSVEDIGYAAFHSSKSNCLTDIILPHSLVWLEYGFVNHYTTTCWYIGSRDEYLSLVDASGDTDMHAENVHFCTVNDGLICCTECGHSPAERQRTLYYLDNWRYIVENGEATIVTYTGSPYDLKVPSTLDDYPVTAIGRCAFYDIDVRTAEIPDSVTRIESGAFSSSPNLKKIVFPKNITSIGASAFEGCSGLQEIVLPDSITNIGAGAFNRCSQLNRVVLPERITSIEDNLFQSCVSLTEIAIPKKVTHIGEYAFDGCINLKYLSLPDGLVSIEYGAFSNCEKLNDVVLPYSLQEVSPSAFDTEETARWYCGSENEYLKVCFGQNYTPSVNEITYVTYNIHFCTLNDTFTCGECGQNRPADQPLLISATDTTITLQASTYLEYSMDGLNWQKSNLFEGLVPGKEYNLYQRVAASESAVAGRSSPVLSVRTRRRTGVVSFDANGGSNAPEAQYKVEELLLTLTEKKPIRDGYILAGWALTPHGEPAYWPGDTYTEEADLYLYALWSPTCNECGGDGLSDAICNSCGGEGQWKHSKNVCPRCKSDYKSYYFNQYVGLYECRSCGSRFENPLLREYYEDCEHCVDGIKEYDCRECDKTGWIKGEDIAAPKPTLLSKTMFSIELQQINDVEYSIDGINWQGSNIFEGLNPNTEYTFYQRYTETSTHLAGLTSEPLIVRTDAPPYTPGDVNADCKINSLDGLILLRYLNGWDITINSEEAMDVNADGKVNSLDGLILMRYLNGWNVTLG